MNKYKEALEFLCDNSKLTQFNIGQSQWASETLQELIDKATPKKPNLLPTLHTFNGSKVEQPSEIIECDCCKSLLELSDKFCSNCGTEIDWE